MNFVFVEVVLIFGLDLVIINSIGSVYLFFLGLSMKFGDMWYFN